jgi:hypothetical protein
LGVGSKIATSSIATLALVGTDTTDRAKRVEDTNVIAGPSE